MKSLTAGDKALATEEIRKKHHRKRTKVATKWYTELCI